MSTQAVVIVTCLVGIGLMVLAGRIRTHGGPGPRPSVGRGLRGRAATRDDGDDARPPAPVEREAEAAAQHDEARRER